MEFELWWLLAFPLFFVLGWLAAGMSHEEILLDYPELTADDILACLAWAAARERHAAWVPAAA